LIGDLTEQFAAGRSGLWYWRQAGGALLLDLHRALRTHALSFVAAVLVGYVLTSLWLFANSLVFGSLYHSLDASRHPLTVNMLMRFMGLRVSQSSITVLVFISGWIVTRIHRAHQRAVLMAFVIAVIAQRVTGLTQLIANVINDSQLSPSLIPEIVRTALQAVFTLVAGLWVIQGERFADMSPRIRFVTALTVALTLGSSLLYDAWRVGALTYPPAERYPVDAAEIASGAYLALLLWRRASHTTATKRVVSTRSVV
jgi:hypothetical protein